MKQNWKLGLKLPDIKEVISAHIKSTSESFVKELKQKIDVTNRFKVKELHERCDIRRQISFLLL